MEVLQQLFENAQFPMTESESGKHTVLRFRHCENAHLPMMDRDSGKRTEVRLVQSENKPQLIVVSE